MRGKRTRACVLASVAALALALAGAAETATPADLTRAAAAYRAQLMADPNRPDLRAALGETLESLGDPVGEGGVGQHRLRQVAELVVKLLESREVTGDLFEDVPHCHGDGRPECPILDDLAGA